MSDDRLHRIIAELDSVPVRYQALVDAGKITPEVDAVVAEALKAVSDALAMALEMLKGRAA